MKRANDRTLETSVAHVYAHATFKGWNGSPDWERLFAHELMLAVGDVVRVEIDDGDKHVDDEHYIVTKVERVLRLNDVGDALIQFIIFEECAPTMDAREAPIS